MKPPEMFFKLIPTKIFEHSTYLIIPLSFFICKSLYNSYIELSTEYKEAVLFKRRHNCVVMYRDKVLIGWPPVEKKLKSSIPKNHLDDLYEPLLYFINTAKHSLDAAFMVVTIKPIWKSLANAYHRGVKVRLLLNFDHCDIMRDDINTLKSKGIDIMTYVSHDNEMNSIMHYKYMVKDFRGGNGYAFMGSSNLSDNAFFNNYEDLVFTSSNEVVQALYDNFQMCFEYVKAENQTLVNRVILADADFL